MTIALIDGDLVAFRCAASAEGEEAFVAKGRASRFIDDIILATEADSYEIWLSGANNFRKEVYPEYKANRLGAPRPQWEQYLKKYLIESYDAKVIDGAEADDALGFRSQEIGDEAVVCTNDKDNKQTPGLHYDPTKPELGIFHIPKDEADRFFWYQMLVGDPVDNLKGIPGIGPIKAKRILAECTNFQEMNDVVADLYPCEEAFLQAADCTWIWRKRGDIWSKRDI